MNAKRFTYSVVILLVVAAIIVEGKKGTEKKSKKESKKEKDDYNLIYPMIRCSQENETGNGTRSEFSRKAQEAMADCMTSMGFSTNDTNNFGNETTSKKQKKAKKKAEKEVKKQRMCLMACSWKELEFLSGDGDSTEFNRTAVESAVQDMVNPDVQTNYMQAMDKCISSKKLSLVNINMGGKCKQMKPYVACMKKAADKACPRPEKMLEKDDDTNDSNSNSSSSESNEDN